MTTTPAIDVHRPMAGMTEAEFEQHLADPMWRLCNLYQIITKGDDGDDEGLVVQFKPNRAQRRFLARMWHRNVILKARQLGFTTLIAILWLDTALFSKDPIRCGIVAQDRDTAEAIFRDKVKFAYEHLPPELLERMPLNTENKSELLWAHNGASIRVATSYRGGTPHRLHVSEFGKISALNPAKAREVVTGSIPAVPKSGMIVIESTAEGQDGHFYGMATRAEKLHEQRAILTPKDYRFHFFPWWQAPEYAIDPDGVLISEPMLEYFTTVEGIIGRALTEGQRAWYVATLNSDFNGEQPMMWQEYPSFPKEAFQVSTEGCYYATQMSRARREGRILPTLPLVALPVNTFWDVGRGDMTSIWFHQRVGPENRFIRYYENSGEELQHYVKYMQDTGYTFGRHYLPHDSGVKRMGATPDTNRTQKEMLEGLMPGQAFDIVTRTSTVMAGIEATRNVFGSAWFSEEGCQKGIARIDNYRKKWNKQMGCWSDEPMHDENSHGADAFRQFGQEADKGNMFVNLVAARLPRNGGGRRPSAMAV